MQKKTILLLIFLTTSFSLFAKVSKSIEYDNEGILFSLSYEMDSDSDKEVTVICNIANRSDKEIFVTKEIFFEQSIEYSLNKESIDIELSGVGLLQKYISPDLIARLYKIFPNESKRFEIHIKTKNNSCISSLRSMITISIEYLLYSEKLDNIFLPGDKDIFLTGDSDDFQELLSIFFHKQRVIGIPIYFDDTSKRSYLSYE